MHYHHFTANFTITSSSTRDRPGLQPRPWPRPGMPLFAPVRPRREVHINWPGPGLIFKFIYRLFRRIRRPLKYHKIHSQSRNLLRRLCGTPQFHKTTCQKNVRLHNLSIVLTSNKRHEELYSSFETSDNRSVQLVKNPADSLLESN